MGPDIAPFGLLPGHSEHTSGYCSSHRGPLDGYCASHSGAHPDRVLELRNAMVIEWDGQATNRVLH